MDRGVGLVAVEMQRAYAADVQVGEGMKIVVVAGAQDGALAVVGEHDRERGALHFPAVHRDLVLGGHVEEHAAEPVVGQRGEHVDAVAEAGGAEARGHRIAAERDRVIARHGLVVARRHRVGEDRNVNVSLSDKKRIHLASLMLIPL